MNIRNHLLDVLIVTGPSRIKLPIKNRSQVLPDLGYETMKRSSENTAILRPAKSLPMVRLVARFLQEGRGGSFHRDLLRDLGEASFATEHREGRCRTILNARTILVERSAGTPHHYLAETVVQELN